MKRIAASLICMMMVAMTFAGCAPSATDTVKPQSTENAAGAQQDAAGDKVAIGKVVYGEISDIAGNEVTLKVIEMPQQMQRDPNASPRPKGEGDTQASPAPQNSDGGNQGGGREIKYTGETAQIIVPVGLKITMNAFGGMGGGQRPQGGQGNGQRQEGDNGQNRPQNSNQPRATRDPNATPRPETEVELSALKVGWTLTITYQADNTTIEKISARQPRSGGMDNASSN